MMNRRQFLKLSGVVLLSSWLGLPVLAQTKKVESAAFCLPYRVPKSDPPKFDQYLPFIKS